MANRKHCFGGCKRLISSMIAAVFFCIASIIDGSGIYSGNPRAAKLSSTRCLVALRNLYCPIRSVPFEMTKRMARKINAFQWPVLIPRAKAITSKIAHRILRINDVFFSVSIFFDNYINPPRSKFCGRERQLNKNKGESLPAITCAIRGEGCKNQRVMEINLHPFFLVLSVSLRKSDNFINCVFSLITFRI